jgi:hypothetical protein
MQMTELVIPETKTGVRDFIVLSDAISRLKVVRTLLERDVWARDPLDREDTYKEPFAKLGRHAVIRARTYFDDKAVLTGDFQIERDLRGGEWHHVDVNTGGIQSVTHRQLTRGMGHSSAPFVHELLDSRYDNSREIQMFAQSAEWAYDHLTQHL